MFLVAGLGNPGEKYHLTRHNIGFLFLDYLAEKLRVNFSASKWQADTAKAMIGSEQVLLLKPQTFMNLSGNAVSGAASFYKIPPEKIIVIHDDIDMPFGRVKVVVNRGTGGHNGIRSILSLLGSKDFIRIKVGIGRPPVEAIPVERYVLTKMTDSEIECVTGMMDSVFESVRIIVCEGASMAMNRINSGKIDNKSDC
ncbi:MAG: aminoacyl-tRNA hydrolase [Proteobacteria bacterium]|nr:aminoacyl-tRNA hydrolase [Pseudomonadota bacterium]MBU4297668.1 aminoacyl-tRNA hydrolase [Pseudomonadota bacterium]MCG2748381.1 aminoacyl-tRNA hydrolase [Desulfobulbaceae bacterium]